MITLLIEVDFIYEYFLAIWEGLGRKLEHISDAQIFSTLISMTLITCRLINIATTVMMMVKNSVKKLLACNKTYHVIACIYYKRKYMRSFNAV